MHMRVYAHLGRSNSLEEAGTYGQHHTGKHTMQLYPNRGLLREVVSLSGVSLPQCSSWHVARRSRASSTYGQRFLREVVRVQPFPLCENEIREYCSWS